MLSFLSLYSIFILSSLTCCKSAARHHLALHRRLNGTRPYDRNTAIAIQFDWTSIYGIYDWVSMDIFNHTLAFSGMGFRLFQRRDTPLNSILLSGTIVEGNDFVATLQSAGDASLMYQSTVDGEDRSLVVVPVALEHIYWTEKVCLANVISPKCPTIGEAALDVEENVRLVLSKTDLQLGVITECQPMCGSYPTVILQGLSGSLVGQFSQPLMKPLTGIPMSSTDGAFTYIAWWAICFLLVVELM